MRPHISRFQRSLLLLAFVMVVLVLASAVIYQLGMTYLEGEPRTFMESLQFAAETITTTGYGEDGRWTHPFMAIFIIILQFIGVFYVFLVIPVFLIPFLEERFETRLPKEMDDIENHVVIYRYGAPVTTLLAELKEEGVEAVILESEESVARQIVRDGHNVVHGSSDARGLAGVRLNKARALIANSTDDKNAALCLVARQLGFDKEIYAMVEDPYHRKPLALAGATAVFTPRHMLGAALAARASSRISPRVSGLQQLGQQLEIAEVRVTATSPLVGKTLIEAAIGSKTHVNIIAKWVLGQLVPVNSGKTVIDANDILVAVGTEAHILQMTRLVGNAPLGRMKGRFVVAGFGEVGRKVHELLTAVDEEVTVIDAQGKDGVDIVGDALDHRIIEAARMGEAQAVIIALDSDSATLFATVVIRDLAPQARIIARVNQPENVERIHRAGAEFALSISQVAGQILARRLLGEEAVTLNPQLKIQKAKAVRLAGSSPSELHIRERTGCTVVAVERGSQVIVSFDKTFRFETTDSVFICGNPESVHRFELEFERSS